MARLQSKYPNDPAQTGRIRRAKGGDQAAFGDIVEKYQTPVYNLCLRMLGEAAAAEDAAQEVFLRAYAKLATYDETRQFSTWLFAIANHYCLDRLKRRRFKMVVWDTLPLKRHAADSAATQPEQALLEAEAGREIQTVLDSLPPAYRAAIILKYWHHLSYEEMAQTLETTVSAVKSKLFRARKMLAARIAQAQQGSKSQTNNLSSTITQTVSFRGASDEKSLQRSLANSRFRDFSLRSK